MQGGLRIQHADISRRIGRIIDSFQMANIEHAAGNDEDDQSKDHSEDQATDVGTFSVLIFVL
jgi:hypothetical protein